MKNTLTILAVIFVGSVLLLVLHTHGHLLLGEYLAYYLWFIPTVLMVKFIRSRFLIKEEQKRIDIHILKGIILFVFLLLVLCSSLNHLLWFYFLNWRHGHTPEFHHFDAGIIRFIYLTQLLVIFFLFYRKKMSFFSVLILVFFQILCIGTFLLKTKGYPLYSDDHPCFIYRIWEFVKTFPQFINYDPNWNAGVCDYSGVETGTISLGLLFWPLWKYFNIVSIYTYVYAGVFIVLIPLLYVFSLRIIGGNWIEACCAGLLSIGVSQYYFLWLFRYGTVGALLSSAFVVPFTCCIFRIIWLGKMEWWLGVMLVLSAFCLVMWPLNLVLGIGILFSFIFSVKKFTGKKILFLSLCFFIFFVLYFKIFAVIARPSVLNDIANSANYNVKRNFFSFLNKSFLFNGWANLVDSIKEGHPLLIFFGIGGIFFLARRDVKYCFLPIFIFLALITGWGEQFNSELQLTRMSIPMFFITIVPTALWVGQLLNIQNARLAIFQAGLCALLLLGGWNCVKMYNNDGFAIYHTIPDDIQEMVSWIKENTSADGRILLAGGNLHVYGGGHAVVLPYLTGREMLACDYVQFQTNDGVEDFPPRQFRKTKETLSEYMELYNITNVIAWEDEYKDIFKAYPDHYFEEATFIGKTVFKVNRKSTLFLKGDGTVKACFNFLNIHTDNLCEDIVIKYNWLDGLSVSPPSQIFPFDAGYGIKFIEIRPNGKQDISIRYKRYL